jgi:hypothetical protein
MSATSDSVRAAHEPLRIHEPPGGRVPIAPCSGPDQRERHPGSGPRAAWLAPPQLPPWPVVWFRREGTPGVRQVDGAIHLWGLAMDDGRSQPAPEIVAADADDPGGGRAWECFVTRAGEIMERCPDARWVHYSPEERIALRACAVAWGAPTGFIERLEEASFELLSRGVRRSLRLPFDPSSLRQVAGLARFQWRSPRPAPGGSTERQRRMPASPDPGERERLLREIADSAAEGLLAMRAVWRWMLERGPREYCG